MDNDKQTDTKRVELLSHIREQIDQQKHDTNIHYAELKLKLKADIKYKTIGELRAAGAIVDPDIHLTEEAQNLLYSSGEAARRKKNLAEKLEEIHVAYRNQITAYYKNIKNKLPEELRDRKMGELSDNDWNYLGLDVKYRTRVEG